MRGHMRMDGLLGDYCDGSDFKQHLLFSQERKALQILLYYDEVEVCNRLGSKVKLHKLDMYMYIHSLCAHLLTFLYGYFTIFLET